MNEISPNIYYFNFSPLFSFPCLSLLFSLHVSQIYMAIYGNNLWKFITMTELHSKKQVLVQCDTCNCASLTLTFTDYSLNFGL